MRDEAKTGGKGRRSAARGGLPPGQHAISAFPRFGSTPYADRLSTAPAAITLAVHADGRRVAALDPAGWAALPRRAQVSDFHCVTTWTSRDHGWEGVGFADLLAALGVPMEPSDRLAVFRASDGYHAALPLRDLAAADVLLADRLDGAPLPPEHGAPVRLIAPAHYGYKSVKHLVRIDIGVDPGSYRAPGPRFMIHPRARVALEERGQGLPGWLLRFAYRPLIRPTVARFARAPAGREGS